MGAVSYLYHPAKPYRVPKTDEEADLLYAEAVTGVRRDPRYRGGRPRREKEMKQTIYDDVNTCPCASCGRVRARGEDPDPRDLLGQLGRALGHEPGARPESSAAVWAEYLREVERAKANVVRLLQEITDKRVERDRRLEQAENRAAELEYALESKIGSQAKRIAELERLVKTADELMSNALSAFRISKNIRSMTDLALNDADATRTPAINPKPYVPPVAQPRGTERIEKLWNPKKESGK